MVKHFPAILFITEGAKTPIKQLNKNGSSTASKIAGITTKLHSQVVKNSTHK